MKNFSNLPTIPKYFLETLKYNVTNETVILLHFFQCFPLSFIVSYQFLSSIVSFKISPTTNLAFPFVSWPGLVQALRTAHLYQQIYKIHFILSLSIQIYFHPFNTKSSDYQFPEIMLLLCHLSIPNSITPPIQSGVIPVPEVPECSVAQNKPNALGAGTATRSRAAWLALSNPRRREHIILN